MHLSYLCTGYLVVCCTCARELESSVTDSKQLIVSKQLVRPELGQTLIPQRIHGRDLVHRNVPRVPAVRAM